MYRTVFRCSMDGPRNELRYTPSRKKKKKRLAKKQPVRRISHPLPNSHCCRRRAATTTAHIPTNLGMRGTMEVSNRNLELKQFVLFLERRLSYF